MTKILTAFSSGILHIVILSTKKEMIWPYAGWIVAVMTDLKTW